MNNRSFSGSTLLRGAPGGPPERKPAGEGVELTCRNDVEVTTDFDRMIPWSSAAAYHDTSLEPVQSTHRLLRPGIVKKNGLALSRIREHLGYSIRPDGLMLYNHLGRSVSLLYQIDERDCTRR